MCRNLQLLENYVIYFDFTRFLKGGRKGEKCGDVKRKGDVKKTQRDIL